MSNTPFDRIWDQHVVREYGGGRALIHIDRHFAQEGTADAPSMGCANAD